MAMTFTLEQQKAITLHGCNILVSAAAGSGKTAVLVERIVRMVCDGENPVDIDRLLIVTFTSAAAAEMRERIAAGISGRLLEHPESEHIQRQATLLHNAQITTIDSFCLFLLRNHFNEIGLDPAFRIADEGEIRLMQREALRELMEDSFLSGSQAFRFCVEYFCPGGRESVLEQHILNLSRYAASFPWPERWLEQRKEDYLASTVEEMRESSYGKYCMEHLQRMLAGLVEKMENVRILCESPDGPYMYGETVDGELEQLRRAAGCTSLGECERMLPAVRFGRLPAKKDDSVSASKRELAKRLRAEVKECAEELAERFFATPLELAARQGAACLEPVCTLIDLTLDFDRRMREKKREKRIIDFSDMEHYALEILLEREGEEIKSSAVAMEYRQYFEEILTDEYQDSNLVQEYLLRAVSGEEDGRFNRFMVGDVKQSIYKFRLARPELFLEKYNTYETGRGNCRRIDLAKNFRSRTQVVEAVNSVFGRLMSETVGGIPYDERAALYPGAAYPENDDCDCEILLVERPKKGEEMSAKRAESLAVAAKIRELRRDFRVTDRETGLLRPARFRDMVILLRTNSGWDEEFREVLEGEGIPVYITSKTGYFAATEVQELLQFLRVLDNPTQDIPLFGVMKSVFGGFSEEEIAKIRSRTKDGRLYEALREFAEGAEEKRLPEAESEAALRTEGTEMSQAPTAAGGKENSCQEGDLPKEEGLPKRGSSPEAEGLPEKEGLPGKESLQEKYLREKVIGFLQKIEEYRSCTVYLPIRELLTKLVNDFGYLDYVTALPGGSKRRANVEMLFTKASDFEQTSYFGLFHFIRYMEQLEKYDVDYGGAELLDENADVVRIMSIHKSKGLEFPITFVAGLSKRFNMQDANQSLILDMDLGLAVDYVDPARRIRNKTLRRTALSRRLREDSLSEELRLLYVAMTRAREKLILTGTLENAREKWELYREAGCKRLSFPDFMQAGCFLDFLLPVLPDSCVQVSICGEEGQTEVEIREQINIGGRRKLLAQAERLCDGEKRRMLEENLTAVYPHAALSGLYTKTTVSELKIAAMADKDEEAYHAFEEKEVLPYIPLFRRGEEKVSGAVRGNAYHRVMELLDFDMVLGTEEANRGFSENYTEYRNIFSEAKLAEGVRAFLRREVESGRLSGEYAQAVKERRIVKFLQSDLAWRMWRAHRRGALYREQPFVLGIDARRLKKDFPEKETVLIQGIIDAFFVEEEGVVLLDYKTDAISSPAELWNRYETQMDYYQEALQKLMKRPVKERILYSFHLEEVCGRMV